MAEQFFAAYDDRDSIYEELLSESDVLPEE